MPGMELRIMMNRLRNSILSSRGSRWFFIERRMLVTK